MSSSPSNATSVLLTDEAIREAARYAARPRSSDWGERLTGPRIEALFGAVLRYHATEGREVLVETVKAVFDERFPYISRDLPVNTMSEAIVDALFGRPE